METIYPPEIEIAESRALEDTARIGLLLEFLPKEAARLEFEQWRFERGLLNEGK